ncbi:hypothetical protein BV20DRAFT_504608 [Pilatotrama ljubarskyi]|nr:hypothetical protein BV20DRAFT_504608 [Pilatotrama ljubarskyi]
MSVLSASSLYAPITVALTPQGCRQRASYTLFDLGPPRHQALSSSYCSCVALSTRIFYVLGQYRPSTIPRAPHAQQLRPRLSFAAEPCFTTPALCSSAETCIQERRPHRPPVSISQSLSSATSTTSESPALLDSG